MRHPHRIAIGVSLALLVSLAAAGCSRSTLTAPEPETAPTAQAVTPPAPPSRLAGPSILSADIQLPPILPLVTKTWYVLTARLVPKAEPTIVSGGRYELSFARGSLDKDALITIEEYDNDILDIELGPHGTVFGEPVVLSIDFAGTTADPGSAWADGREPVVYWLNEKTNLWEEVPGTTDWARRRHNVRLEHFSRYVVGGKAGWKQQPNREQD